MSKLFHTILITAFHFVVATSLFVSSQDVWAGEEEDLAEMQRQLNAEVMAQPFDPDDVARVDAYIEQAMKEDLKPRTKPPSYWRPGYTCANIYNRGYRAWRDCRYHYRYYGRYW